VSAVVSKKYVCLWRLFGLNPSASRFPIAGPKPLNYKKKKRKKQQTLPHNGLQSLFGEKRIGDGI
jgi:hypothetical protein